MLSEKRLCKARWTLELRRVALSRFFDLVALLKRRGGKTPPRVRIPPSPFLIAPASPRSLSTPWKSWGFFDSASPSPPSSFDRSVSSAVFFNPPGKPMTGTSRAFRCGATWNSTRRGQSRGDGSPSPWSGTAPRRRAAGRDTPSPRPRRATSRGDTVPASSAPFFIDLVWMHFTTGSPFVPVRSRLFVSSALFSTLNFRGDFYILTAVPVIPRGTMTFCDAP